MPSGTDLSSPFVAPGLTVALCVLAAVGTMLALPGRTKTQSLRIAGGGMMALALVATMMLMIAGAGRAIGSVHYVYFWIFSVVAIVCSARVITHRQPVYSALYFVMTVFASAGLFVLMWAEFLAAALVIIYAGAILVTYTFVIMLAAESSGSGLVSRLAGGRAPVPEHDAVSREPIVASLTGFGVLGALIFVIFDRAKAIQPYGYVTKSPAVEQSGSIRDLATYLFSHQIVSMQIAGLILTLAMVGAIMIARKRVLLSDDEAEVIIADELTAPNTPVDDNPHSISVQGEAGPRSRKLQNEIASLD
ncbi:MAG TPA: NADH-quinone oxidoreductase subunit J [Tepidisphaeraceae bacterium]|nr:NADH-quinone oxidoreductase subunit J [Tepidisphaeraceae bacterium]